jgi:hypothetical protein
LSDKDADVWACDHLWIDWDAGRLTAIYAIGSAIESQATDTNYNFDIPVCDACEAQRTHVSVSRRTVPHPWVDDGFYKEADDWADSQGSALPSARKGSG